MESNSIIDINNNKNDNNNESLLLSKKINNKLYKGKKKLPKLNISNLSNSVGNFNNIQGNNKIRNKKIILTNLNNEDETDYSREIMEAKEIKDLEKIYDKWLHRKRPNYKQYEIYYTEELPSNKDKEKLENNNTKSKKNIKNVNKIVISSDNKNNNSKNDNNKSNTNNLFLKTKKKNLLYKDNGSNKKNDGKEKENNLKNKITNSNFNKNKIKIK